MSASAFAILIGIGAALALFFTAVAHESRAIAQDADVQLATRRPTDAETRAAMENIRTRVIEAHTLITHRRLPVASARQFASALKSETERISRIRSERLPPPDPLAPFLAKIVSGGEAVAGRTEGRDPIDGLVDIVDALESYARDFEHPGWRPLQSQ